MHSLVRPTASKETSAGDPYSGPTVRFRSGVGSECFSLPTVCPTDRTEMDAGGAEEVPGLCSPTASPI